MDSVLREEERLRWEEFVKLVGFKPGARMRELRNDSAVMQECWKHDNASQWKSIEYDLSPSSDP